MGSQEAVDPVRHQFLRHTRITVVRTVEIKALRLRICQACIRSYTLGRMICLCPRYGAKALFDEQSMMVGSPAIWPFRSKTAEDSFGPAAVPQMAPHGRSTSGCGRTRHTPPKPARE